jgi:hypothetical protein
MKSAGRAEATAWGVRMGAACRAPAIFDGRQGMWGTVARAPDRAGMDFNVFATGGDC